MLEDAIEAERAERDQDADCARIDAAIGLSEQDIAALEDRQLDPDEMRKQWSAIRDRTILAIRDVVHNVVKRAIEAKATEDRMIQNLCAKKVTEGLWASFSRIEGSPYKRAGRLPPLLGTDRRSSTHSKRPHSLCSPAGP